MRTLCLVVLLGWSTLPAAAAVPSPPPAPAPGDAGTGTSAEDLTALREKMDASKSGGNRERLPGAAIYTQRCQLCHEGQVPKAPSRTFI
jgi:cytochrome c5